MKTALRNAILLLFCVTTTFCGPHDETEQSGHHADGVRSEPGIPESHRLGSVQDTPIVPGTTAGYLSGTSAVTPTGEFTYRIDLDVPAGRTGMEPSLSITYGSRSGNGLLGVGWRLGSLSEIHRCAKTFSQDGFADGIDFDDDNLCLDGQKLVALSSGAGETEYRTEQDGMSRILAHEEAGRTTFTIYKKDGRIREYAPVIAKREERTDADSDGDIDIHVTDVELAWLLSKERDRAGNEIR